MGNMHHRQDKTVGNRPKRHCQSQDPNSTNNELGFLTSWFFLWAFIYIYIYIYIYILYIYIYVCMYLGCTRSQVQYAGSGSPTRDQTWLPCTGRVESQPLDHLAKTLGIVGFQSDSFVITSSASNWYQFLPLDCRPWHPGWNTTARQWHTYPVGGVYSPTQRFPSSA